MLDRFSALQIFVLAAELGSFTAVGRRLGISASAVGKAIGRLEERIGARLFHRSTRSIALTTEGEIFHARCQRIFAELEAAEAEMATSKAAPAGRLRVSMPLTSMLLTPVLAAFTLAYPQIELDIDFSDRLVDIVEEGFDLVLRTGQAEDSRLMTRKVGSYTYAIVASPEYLARAGTPLQPEDLLTHSCLHHRRTTTGKLVDWRLRRNGKYLNLPLPVTIAMNTVEPLIGLAERGIGLAPLPTFTIRRQLAEGTLVPVLEPYLSHVGTFRLLWPEGRQSLPRVRAFIDYMTEHLLTDLSQR